VRCTQALDLAGQEGRDLIEFEDGRAVLVEGDAGAGRVLMFAVTADAAWSNLPKRPLFVALLHRAVYRLLRGGSGTVGRTVGEAIPLPRLATLGPGASVEVYPPDREDDPVRFSDASRGESVFDDTSRPGLYRIAVRAGPRRTESRVPVNVNPAEGRLARFGLPALTASLEGVEVRAVDAGGDLEEELRRARMGRPVWSLLLALAILVLVVEAWLANRWARPAGARRHPRGAGADRGRGPAAAGRGRDPPMSVDLHTAWPPMLGFVVAVALLGGIVLLYRGLRGKATPRRRLGFLALRIAAALLLLLLALEPVLRADRLRAEDARVVVLVDTSASMATPDSYGDRPRLDVARDLLLGEDGIVEVIEDEIPVSLVRFDTGARPSGEDDLRGARADGAITDLAGSLRAIAARGGRLAAVVLVSDGAHNAGGDAREAAAGVAAPVFAVGWAAREMPARARRTSR
jgi:hypothetical protein